MSNERKILIIAGVIIMALAVFGFKGNKQHAHYEGCGHDGYANAGPSNAQAYEFYVTYFQANQFRQNWQDMSEYRAMQDHLNNMGANGWQLVHVEDGRFSDEYVFLFTRPVARWR